MISKEVGYMLRILILIFAISSIVENGYASIDKLNKNKINQTMKTYKYFKQFTYNQNDQLIKLEYKYGEKAISTSRAGMMDGSMDVAPITDIKYDENFEIRHFFDKEGKPSTNNMNVYKVVYEYNDIGERVSLKYYDKDNKPIDNSWGICEYIWEKNGDYKVLEKRKNISGEYTSIRPYYKFMTVIYEYHPNGTLASMKNVDDTGKLIVEETGIAVDEPVYDEKLQLVSFKFYDANGKNVIGSFLGSASGEFIYDDKGNDIEFVKTDLEGNPILGSENSALTKQKYDEFGNLTEQSFFDEQGMPATEINPSTKKEFTKVEFIYDKENLALKPEIVFSK